MSTGRARLFRHSKGEFDQLHDPVGFDEDLYDLLIMAHIIERQSAPLPVLQPFLRGLIATDVEFPRNGRHVFEPLVGVDEDFPLSTCWRGPRAQRAGRAREKR